MILMMTEMNRSIRRDGLPEKNSDESIGQSVTEMTLPRNIPMRSFVEKKVQIGKDKSKRKRAQWNGQKREPWVERMHSNQRDRHHTQCGITERNVSPNYQESRCQLAFKFSISPSRFIPQSRSWDPVNLFVNRVFVRKRRLAFSLEASRRGQRHQIER